MQRDPFSLEFDPDMAVDSLHDPFADWDDADDALPSDEDEEGERQHHPSLLETTALADFFGADGPLSQVLDSYELRPSQLQMAEAVKRAILERRTALIEAPTGTGKSIAYLLPALLSGRTVVIATANKSLQSQLFLKDIPFLRQVLKKDIAAVLVKGRSNFVCTLKWEKEQLEQRTLAMYDRENEQVAYLHKWLDKTDTGDVDDLPFILENDLRPRIVSYPDDCIHRNCPHFNDSCFVNWMRDKARQAQVLITNHHLLLTALQMGEGGYGILPEGSIYVVDEAHQLEATATSVFEVEVSDYALTQLLARNTFKEQVDADRLDGLRMQSLLAFSEADRQSNETVFRIESDLEELKKLAGALKALQDEMRLKNPYQKPDETAPPQPKDPNAEAKAHYELALEGLGSLYAKLETVATSKRDDRVVRYAERVRGARISLRLHAAPIDPAGLLQEYLFGLEEKAVVCTSATLATDGHFEHFKARCGVEEGSIDLVAGTVFDYPNQALLYQPSLPAYDWRAKDVYYKAVSGEIERLLEASRGRALCLFTNWSGLQSVREELAHSVWPIRSQGDYPRDALLDWFRGTPHSVLLATKSFWEGVDLPGDDLSLVVLDKMPFPTPSDPLHSARMKALDDAAQGSSFGKYMLPLMALSLKQGFGRLIRRSDDKGVVAILDERLTSKSYGRQVRQDLPPARFSRTFADVHRFFKEALASRADFALNVQASQEEENDPFTWRWRLLRLQDGKADGEEGTLRRGDKVTAEMHAAIEGLKNLRARISDAGRTTHSFGVELRCSAATEAALAAGQIENTLRKRWTNECSVWGSLDVIGLGPVS
ncbi:MAG: ATP-dependent DNA helicase [Chloroflexi bacterium]|nr:MAG: ATP-dependent DNA helicase [Chloroflexota bacterium]